MPFFLSLRGENILVSSPMSTKGLQGGGGKGHLICRGGGGYSTAHCLSLSLFTFFFLARGK